MASASRRCYAVAVSLALVYAIRSPESIDSGTHPNRATLIVALAVSTSGNQMNYSYIKIIQPWLLPYILALTNLGSCTVLCIL